MWQVLKKHNKFHDKWSSVSLYTILWVSIAHFISVNTPNEKTQKGDFELIPNQYIQAEDIPVKNAEQATEYNKCECIGSPIYVDNYFSKKSTK